MCVILLKLGILTQIACMLVTLLYFMYLKKLLCVKHKQIFWGRCHTCDFVAQLCRTKKIASVTWRVAQLLFRTEQCSFLRNFVARMPWTLIGQFLFMRQSYSTTRKHN